MIIYIPNSPQWVITWFGIQKVGGMAVPITPIYTSYDLQYIANDSGAETVICADTNYGYVQRAMTGANIRRIIVTNVVDLLPWWKESSGILTRYRRKVSKDDKTYSSRTISKSVSLPRRMRQNGEQIAEILYTGGTTKFPKGVPIAHDLFLECSNEQLSVSEPFFPKEENLILGGAPMFHILGQACGLATLCMGGTLILQPKVNLDGVLETIQRFKVKTFIGVPALYRMIEHDLADFYIYSPFNTASVRAMSFQLGVPGGLKDIRSYWGYGATETRGGGYVPGRRIIPQK
jgi:long-chain acyl-CoA synthetase